MKDRDKDLVHYTPVAKDITVRVRDIFDECQDSKTNPRWLPGLLIQEMYSHDLIDEFQMELFRRQMGL